MSAAGCGAFCSGKCATSSSLGGAEARGLSTVPQGTATDSSWMSRGRDFNHSSQSQWLPLQRRAYEMKKPIKIMCHKAVQNFSPELAGDGRENPRRQSAPGPLDGLFLQYFREKMTEGVGWESPTPGYDGLLEVVNHLYTNSSKSETEKAAVRIFKSLFPGWVLLAFRKVILPIASGKVAAVLMAFVTQATTKWLMGPSTVNKVTLADGSTLPSGVLVERCKFLEESKCAGICTHMCKIPTQEFFKTVMGVPVAMEPNFIDFSCQFNIGVESLPRDQDPGLQTGCLSICPTAGARYTLRQVQTDQCPQVQ